MSPSVYPAVKGGGGGGGGEEEEEGGRGDELRGLGTEGGRGVREWRAWKLYTTCLNLVSTVDSRSHN